MNFNDRTSPLLRTKGQTALWYIWRPSVLVGAMLIVVLIAGVASLTATSKQRTADTTLPPVTSSTSQGETTTTSTSTTTTTTKPKPTTTKPKPTTTKAPKPPTTKAPPKTDPPPQTTPPQTNPPQPPPPTSPPNTNPPGYAGGTRTITISCSSATSGTFYASTVRDPATTPVVAQITGAYTTTKTGPDLAVHFSGQGVFHFKTTSERNGIRSRYEVNNHCQER